MSELNRRTTKSSEQEMVNIKISRFAVVEAYKAIRTNIMFVLAQNDGKVICFSSAEANEGKSTTAVNIAITFSQLGGKVLLIDADLRRSTVHKKMKLENSDGLSNVLVGFSTLDKAINHVNDSLDVLTAGPQPPNPLELLGSKKFATFIEKCREEYDYVIIDTPPVNIVSDALMVAPLTDGLIMIARDNITQYDSLNHAIDSAKFANINILGTIMNGVDMRRNRRYSYRKGYGYGKKSAYKYGKYGYGYARYAGYGGGSRSKGKK